MILSDKTEQLILKLFAENDLQMVRNLVENELGNDLPFCMNCSPVEMERIRFAAIKLSEGYLDKIRCAIRLAKSDWRDLLVSSNFADNANSHEKWANEILNI